MADKPLPDCMRFGHPPCEAFANQCAELADAGAANQRQKEMLEECQINRDAWWKAKDAAEAERDELTAQLAAARDIAGSIQLYAEAGSKIWELSCAILSDLPARAGAMQAVVEAASNAKFLVLDRGHAAAIVEYQDYGELARAVVALMSLDQPEQEQEE